MISKKIFEASGSTNRFLSDFIIRSTQYARPYVFVYDGTLAVDGTEDVLQDGSTDQSNWSFPTNVWKRGTNTPKSGDLVTTEYWDVVDNSVLFYDTPTSNSTVWIEVATTSSEFGDTLVAPAVERAEAAAAVAVASSVAASISEVNAGNSEGISLVQAGIATTKAAESLASANASEASRQVSDANVLLTNADVITTNNNVASTNEDVITTNANVSTSTTQAGISTAQAVIATTKASEASSSASTATTQAGVATSEANRAEGYAISIDPSNILHTIGSGLPNESYDKTEIDAINTWVANDSRAKTALNASGIAPIYACRAWVNFNGTGTVAIRDSGNVSSITDNGTGDYTANLAVPLVDEKSSASVSTSGSAAGDLNATQTGCKVLSSSSINIETGTDTASLRDSENVYLLVFR